MLVLSRVLGEDILIANGTITVRVLEIRGGRVRLGIVAPPECSVHRREVYDRLQQEATHASAISTKSVA